MKGFDPFDHHEYGLIQVRKGVYIRCTNRCCKAEFAF